MSLCTRSVSGYEDMSRQSLLTNSASVTRGLGQEPTLNSNSYEKIVTIDNGPVNITSQKYEETPKPYQLIENVNSNTSEEIFDIKDVQRNVTSLKNDEIKKLLLHSWIASKGYEHDQYWGQNETESAKKGKKFQKE